MEGLISRGYEVEHDDDEDMDGDAPMDERTEKKKKGALPALDSQNGAHVVLWPQWRQQKEMCDLRNELTSAKMLMNLCGLASSNWAARAYLILVKHVCIFNLPNAIFFFVVFVADFSINGDSEMEGKKTRSCER